jgi:flagellar basal-body rod protein FlgC
MSMFQIFNVAGSAVSAQSQRLNVVASNLANADTVAGPEQRHKAAGPDRMRARRRRREGRTISGRHVVWCCRLPSADAERHHSNQRGREMKGPACHQNNVEVMNTARHPAENAAAQADIGLILPFASPKSAPSAAGAVLTPPTSISPEQSVQR